jgi:hypothetical protein
LARLGTLGFSRLGGLIGGADSPIVRGSRRSLGTAGFANPIMRGSVGLGGCSGAGVILSGLVFLAAARNLSARSFVDFDVSVASGEGLSSLLGGVLNGDIFASTLPFRCC